MGFCGQFFEASVVNVAVIQLSNVELTVTSMDVISLHSIHFRFIIYLYCDMCEVSIYTTLGSNTFMKLNGIWDDSVKVYL
jgi:hypothetical protein